MRRLIPLILACLALAIPTAAHASFEDGGGGGAGFYWKRTWASCILPGSGVIGRLWQEFYDPAYLYPTGAYRCGG